MHFAADDVRASVMYQHLVHCLVPRPIAWVSTRSARGVTNVAPFSFFTGVGSRPPSLLFCPANNRDGEAKDTLRNIADTGDFVVNVVSVALTEAMNATSAELPPDVSEFEVNGLTAIDSVRVKAPRVAEASVHFECERMQILQIGDGPGGANIVIGRIVYIHIDDSVVGVKGLVDPNLLDAVGRMGGVSYCRTRDTFDLPRP